MKQQRKGYTMGKHRLQGRWFSPATSTVFVCSGGEIHCTVRGYVGRSSRKDVQIGTAWDSVCDNKYSDEGALILDKVCCES